VAGHGDRTIDLLFLCRWKDGKNRKTIIPHVAATRRDLLRHLASRCKFLADATVKLFAGECLDNEFSLRKSDCRSPTLLIYDNRRFYLIAAVENSGRCFCGWHKIFRVFSLSFFFVISCYRCNDWRRVCNLIINYNFIISTFKINWFFFFSRIVFHFTCLFSFLHHFFDAI